MKYNIFVDLDGVLVDFDKGYKDLTGIDLNKLPFQDGKSFWDPINKAGKEFWSNLKWMKDGKKLWNFVSQFNPKILSAPSKDKSSHKGKQEWVSRELKNVQLILCPAKDKQKYASNNSILIDDRIDNCERWEMAGGIAIPHTNSKITISQLIKILFNE